MQSHLVSAAVIPTLLFALLGPLAAQCGTTSIATLANGATSFGVGGGNYFDVNVTNPAGIVVCAIDTKTTAPASAAIAVEIYMTPNTYVGNHTNAAVWDLVATGSGVGIGSGAAFPPVPITLSNPFYLPFGSHGLFVRITAGGGPQYVQGANTFTNADVTLTLGASQSVAFSSALATPRTWNGSLHYTPGGGPGAGALGFLGAGCAGSLPVSTIRATAQPIVGQTMSVTVDQLPQNLAILILGLSSTTSPLGPLPLDLTVLGAPGCFGRVSPDVLLTLTGTGNAATFALPIPSSPLAGAVFHMQALVFDPPANSFGLVASHAVTAVIGG